MLKLKLISNWFLLLWLPIFGLLFFIFTWLTCTPINEIGQQLKSEQVIPEYATCAVVDRGNLYYFAYTPENESSLFYLALFIFIILWALVMPTTVKLIHKRGAH